MDGVGHTFWLKRRLAWLRRSRDAARTPEDREGLDALIEEYLSILEDVEAKEIEAGIA